jgi:hercynylcysteine S-oxide lyase
MAQPVRLFVATDIYVCICLMLSAGNGTIDFVPYLSIKAAIEFRHWLGGEEKINEYCHDLAMKGGEKLAEVLGTKVMGNAEEITLNMV